MRSLTKYYAERADEDILESVAKDVKFSVTERRIAKRELARRNANRLKYAKKQVKAIKRRPVKRAKPRKKSTSIFGF